MRAMAETAKIMHTDKEFGLQGFGEISTAYPIATFWIRPTTPRSKRWNRDWRSRLESLQAILDELAPTDARAKNVKPQEMVDNRYLDEMNKSGFMDQLWSRK